MRNNENGKETSKKKCKKSPSMYHLYGRIGALRKEVMGLQAYNNDLFERYIKVVERADRNEESADFWQRRANDRKEIMDGWRSNCFEWKNMYKGAWGNLEKAWAQIDDLNKTIDQRDEEITRLRQIIYNISGQFVKDELVLTDNGVKQVMPTWPCN